MSNKYDKGDAAKDTGPTKGEVSGAWHQTRDDAVGSGQLERGGGSGGSKESFSRSDESGQRTEGFWSSVFGGGKK